MNKITSLVYHHTSQIRVFFHSAVHVALKIQGDLNEYPDHQGCNISEKASNQTFNQLDSDHSQEWFNAYLQYIPQDTCLESITCSCKIRCVTNRCKCRKAILSCTGAEHVIVLNSPVSTFVKCKCKFNLPVFLLSHAELKSV